MTGLLKRGSTYDEVCDNFAWHIHELYKIAEDVCDRWGRRLLKDRLKWQDRAGDWAGDAQNLSA